MTKNNKFEMPVPVSTNQIEAEKKVEAKDVTFVLNNQTQLINDDAFQLQEDFVSFHEGKNEGNEDLANIQQQLMQHFDDFEEFDEDEDDVQAALNFS